VRLVGEVVFSLFHSGARSTIASPVIGRQLWGPNLARGIAAVV